MTDAERLAMASVVIQSKDTLIADLTAKRRELVRVLNLHPDTPYIEALELFKRLFALQRASEHWKKQAQQAEAKLAAVACEVCWTTSWTPIERIEEANGVNTKHRPDGSDLARCEHCYLQAKLAEAIANADAYKSSMDEAHAEAMCDKEKLAQAETQLANYNIVIEEQRLREYKLVEKYKKLEALRCSRRDSKANPIASE